MIQVEHADLLINLSVLLDGNHETVEQISQGPFKSPFPCTFGKHETAARAHTRAEASAHLRVRPVSRRVNDLGD